ncbi:MAG: type I-U CRISPR-associated protein Cas5/Cas6 [Marinosulfonomonas sp.]|nr:type I-U CRISPR-associated protein Cas5/Cas6 [Marinosulfonomonas sp.]
MADTLKPTTWRWRLSGHDLPPLTHCVTVGRATRAMLIRQAKSLSGSPNLPFPLHGHNEKNRPAIEDGRHRHAFFLPEDIDRDGIIDHVTVYASSGFDDASLYLLGACNQLTVGNGAAWRAFDIVTVHVGESDELRAREWVSSTPFVSPLPLKRSKGGKARHGRSARNQLQSLLSKRRSIDFSPLPDVIIDAFTRESEEQDFPAAEAFRIGKKNADRPGVQLERAWFRIVFEQEVEGPLAFGLQDHFGLGRFTPVE